MKVKLYDWLDCLVHIAEIKGALPKVLVWGDEAYEKVGKRRYRQTSMKIITDTRGEIKT